MERNYETDLRGRVADLVLERFPEGADRALESASPDDFRSLIQAAHVVSDEAGHSLARWVDAGRHAGLSWAEIGDVLHVSRQAAQQRFARTTQSPNDLPPDHELITRTGMTAFNEVPILQEEGRAGNELIGAAPFNLFFAPRGVPHDNIRVTSLRAAPIIRKYEKKGWSHALTWYPFHYFTRQTPSES